MIAQPLQDFAAVVGRQSPRDKPTDLALRVDDNEREPFDFLGLQAGLAFHLQGGVFHFRIFLAGVFERLLRCGGLPQVSQPGAEETLGVAWDQGQVVAVFLGDGRAALVDEEPPGRSASREQQQDHQDHEHTRSHSAGSWGRRLSAGLGNLVRFAAARTLDAPAGVLVGDIELLAAVAEQLQGHERILSRESWRRGLEYRWRWGTGNRRPGRCLFGCGPSLSAGPGARFAILFFRGCRSRQTKPKQGSPGAADGRGGIGSPHTPLWNGNARS